MLTYNRAFVMEIKEIIEADAERIKEELTEISVSEASWRVKQGEIRGLRRALEHCDEAMLRVDESARNN